MTASFYSCGKLLITGEYVVLDGATALALPTKYGQQLLISDHNSPELLWKSIDHEGLCWFEHVFSIQNEQVFTSSEDPTAKALAGVLQTALNLNPNFKTQLSDHTVTTTLEFPLDWGLGSSSTLINNIAQWAGVDSYELLFSCFGGSGYDIAVALNGQPLLYTLKEQQPVSRAVSVEWPFTENLYFVHLNKKKNSRSAIAHYKAVTAKDPQLMEQISRISHLLVSCTSIESFGSLLETHEQLLAKLLQLPTVKQDLFKEFPGFIKSLGGWGGDFILAGCTEDPRSYFHSRGFHTVIPFSEMIKK